MNLYRRMTALILAALLVSLAGCGGREPGIAVTAPAETAAMGRYVEQDLELPEDGTPLDMVMLSTGQLRIALRGGDDQVRIYTTGPDRTTWEQPLSLQETKDTEWISEYGFALSPTGEVFYSTADHLGDDGPYTYRLFAVSGSGETRELPITYPNVDPDSGLLIWGCDFTDDGRLFAIFDMEQVCELDLETGALGKNVNELEPSVFSLCCAGDTAYMICTSQKTTSVHRDGKTEPLTGVLQEKIAQSLQATEGYTNKLTFWENDQGYLFFTTDDGLYSYIPGGSVLERLVEGNRSSLSDPSFFPDALTGAEDGSFYVLGQSGDGLALHRYVYDPNVPTVPDTTLRVYSLYDDEILRRTISRYQKSHPEVAIEFEVGISGDDAVTPSDAIRTLNTEILAGSGPDILELDGFSLDAFLKKGLLAPLSGVIRQAGPLIEPVTNCYAVDGQVRALPTGFVLPVIYGPGHIVSQIQDLDSLVAAATQAREENPEAQSVMVGIASKRFADQFYDSCSAAWIRPDGTLDGEKLTAYYDAMQRLYALDQGLREELGADMVSVMAEEDQSYVPGQYNGSSGALMIVTKVQCLSPGSMYSMDDWANMLAGDEQLEGYETVPINLQGGNVFLPRRVMGILTTSAYPQAAEEFLAYMLSREVQTTSGWSDTFPVNREVFDREIREDREATSTFGMSDAEGNPISLSAQWPDARRRQELKTWVDALDTPALTNQIIRTMVMNQMNDCLNGKLTPQQAAQNALKDLNLYLSE